MLRYITGWTRQQYTLTLFRIMTIHLYGTKTNINSTTLRVLHFAWCLQAASVNFKLGHHFIYISPGLSIILISIIHLSTIQTDDLHSSPVNALQINKQYYRNTLA